MNEITSPVGKWVEIIVLREISLTHKIKNSVFSHMNLGAGRMYELTGDLRGCRRREGRGREGGDIVVV